MREVKVMHGKEVCEERDSFQAVVGNIVKVSCIFASCVLRVACCRRVVITCTVSTVFQVFMYGLLRCVSLKSLRYVYANASTRYRYLVRLRLQPANKNQSAKPGNGKHNFKTSKLTPTVSPITS